MNRTLTLVRTGIVRVTKDQASRYQCGRVGHRKYWYEVAVSIQEEAANQVSGFVIDHNLIHDAVVDAFSQEVIVSCEDMATLVGSRVSQAVPRFIHINVRLGAMRRWPFGKGMGHTSYTISR
jgi:hypothetical protein